MYMCIAQRSAEHEHGPSRSQTHLCSLSRDYARILQAAREKQKKAINRALQRTPITLLRKKAADIYESNIFQKIMGLLLLLNFALNVTDAEIAGYMRNEESENSTYAAVAAFIDEVDLAFTLIYILELLLNLFVNWWTPFISDGWSLFDSFCVLVGLFGTVSGVSSAQVGYQS